MKDLLKKLLDNSTEIIVGLFILAAIIGIAKLAYRRIENYFYKEVAYVYACPQNTQSSKCYKVKADYLEGAWINKGNDYEPGYFEKIYFDDGGYIAFNSCEINDQIYTCYPEDDKDGIWKLQISEVIKVKK